MTKPKYQDIDIILHVIVILSILITTLLDAIKCLTSLNSASSTPTPGKQDLPSKDIKYTKSGSTKTQRLSPSTKRRSTTAVQKRAAGGTKQDSQSSPTASSPRGKRSKPSSNTLMNMRSQTSQALETPRRITTTKSTSPTTLLRSTPKPNHTTADDAHSHTTDWIEHQPTEPLHVLLEPQQEVQEHTVLRTKVSRSKLKG
jgi:hypothetical protein